MSRNVTINSGDVHGRLTVIGYEHTYRKSRYYKCICSCGKEVILAAYRINSGHTKSCGCLRKETSRAAIDGVRPDYYLGASVSPRNKTIARYKGQAKRAGREYTLTIDEFVSITQRVCHYCGNKPSNVCVSDKDPTNVFSYNGIDRKDNNKGYTIDNVVSCCRVCNRAKNNMQYIDYIAWVKQSAQHLERYDK